MRERIWTRRTFCRVLIVGPAAFALSGAKQAMAGASFRPHYILGSSMYGTMRLRDILPEVRKTGTEYLDIWPRPHGDQREQMDALGREQVAEMFAHIGVRLGMTTRYDLKPFQLDDEIRFVSDWGGRLVVTGSVGPADVSGVEAKSAVAEFVEQMKPHTALAEERQVAIGIENRTGTLLSTPDSLRYFAEFARSSNLGVAMAPYHLPQDEKLLAGLIRDLGPRLVHFYAWQYGRGCMSPMPKEQELQQMPGRGSLDFVPLLAALGEIGYQGWTEVFMHPTPRGIPILKTAAEVTAEINRARKYLEECIDRP